MNIKQTKTFFSLLLGVMVTASVFTISCNNENKEKTESTDKEMKQTEPADTTKPDTLKTRPVVTPNK